MTIDYIDLADKMFEKSLRFSNGKWLYEGKVITEGYLARLLHNQRITDKTKFDLFKNTFLLVHDTPELKWGKMPIIEEAERYTPKPMCYPLTNKQLIILNRLLKNTYGNENDEVVFILYGLGGTGKSTFANIIKQAFDNDVYESDLECLLDVNNLGSACEHRLICSTDLNSDDLKSGTFKKLISREQLMVAKKYVQPYNVKCQSVFFFNCNTLPRVDITDSGFVRRIVYMNMNKVITNPDTTLKDKVWTREDIINIIAHALKVDTEDWRELFIDETRLNLVKNNNVYILRKDIKSVDDYDNYKNLCYKKGYKPYAENKFQEVYKIIKEWNLLNDRAELIPLDTKDPIFGLI